MRHANLEHDRSLTPAERIGAWVTNGVGTMWAALIFTVFSIVSLPAVMHTHDPIIIINWLDQTFLQLVLLPIILVGQNVQAKHDKIAADIDHQVNLKAEQIAERMEEKLDLLLKRRRKPAP